MLFKLKSAFDDDARQTLADLSESVRDDLTLLVAEFQDTYGTNINPLAARMDLNNFQKDDESLQQFSKRVKRNVQKGHGHLKGEAARTMAVQCFINGVLDKKAAQWAINTGVETIPEVINIMTINQTYSEPSTSSKVRQMRGTSNSFPRNSLDGMVRTSDNRSGGSRDNSRERKRNLSCWHCGITGHFENECWKKQKGEPRTASFEHPRLKSAEFRAPAIKVTNPSNETVTSDAYEQVSRILSGNE